MKKGKARFAGFLTQLGTLLREAGRQANPAGYLLEHNARTPLFMLEGLARLYSNLHDKPMFSKIKAQFKELEDLLGQIDYYTSLQAAFNTGNPAREKIVEELSASAEKSTSELNKVLKENKWLGKSPKRLKKIGRKLDGAKWMKEKKELEAIRSFYQNSIVEIKVFYGNANGHFTEIEYQVHSLRRKLRWLSIYPQALQGCIQLSDTHPVDESLEKYLIPEIVTSPFNKMPEPVDNNYTLLLEKNYFLALSYMIDALGKLKDEGLSLLAAETHIRNSHQPGAPSNDLAHIETNKQVILDKASSLCASYFEENNLENLVLDVRSIEAGITDKPGS